MSVGNQSLTDQQLVKRVQEGDKSAFDMLVRKYQHKIIGLVGRYVFDSHEAMDVSQEAFIKAYRALPGFRGDSAFYTWLYRIAINTAKNHLVSRGRRPPAVDVDIGDVDYQPTSENLQELDTPENNLYKDELEKAVYHTLDQLPEDLRMALTLREFEGMSYEEIAQVMDCPVGTVRSRIFRAREAIDRVVKPMMNEFD